MAHGTPAYAANGQQPASQPAQAPAPQPTAIAGAVTRPLREIATEGGPVLHMVRQGSPLFSGFGEMYFSEVEAGAVKGWKRHSLQTQLFAVPVGSLKVVLFDARSASPTKGVREEMVLGRPEHYRLLRIPPGVWYAFGAHGERAALVANLADLPHDPTESEKLPLAGALAPCHWTCCQAGE